MVNFVLKLIKIINEHQLLSGIFFGWLFSRLMDFLKKPTLSFEVSDDKEFTRGNKKYKFLNIIVKNEKQSIFKKFLFGNPSLNNARVWLRFLDPELEAEMLKINGRWASTKEPVDYQSGKPIISDILLPSRESIPVGESASVSVAIKEFGENYFFAFNNESYLHNWKKPDYELNEKKYTLFIDILADGNEYSHKFFLVNPPRSLGFFKIIKF